MSGKVPAGERYAATGVTTVRRSGSAETRDHQRRLQRPWLLPRQRPLARPDGDVTNLATTPVVGFTAQLQAKIVNALKPYLSAPTGPLTISANLEGRHEGQMLQLAKLSTTVNRDANARMMIDLSGWRWVPHVGIGDDGWQEEGFFVFDLPEATAVSIAHRYGQVAVVAIHRGGPARLILTGRAPASAQI
jgi:hypothetical protein